MVPPCVFTGSGVSTPQRLWPGAPWSATVQGPRARRAGEATTIAISPRSPRGKRGASEHQGVRVQVLQESPNSSTAGYQSQYIVPRETSKEEEGEPGNHGQRKLLTPKGNRVAGRIHQIGKANTAITVAGLAGIRAVNYGRPLWRFLREATSALAGTPIW